MVKRYWQKAIASCLLSIGMFAAVGNEVKAESPETLPSNLRIAISGIENAANNQDLSELVNFYNANFVNSDGLTIEGMTQSLEKIWTNYPRLRYQTTIESWTQQGEQIIVETITRINGSQIDQDRTINLSSTVRSRQYFQDQKIIRQEIVSEQTELKTGDQPPAIKAITPETVQAGETYNFDVIVTEPLGDNVLLGAAIDERTGSDRYISPSTFELEPLSAGGIYKVVTAPLLPDNHWLSAIIVRSNGITVVTKRVKIESN